MNQHIRYKAPDDDQHRNEGHSWRSSNRRSFQSGGEVKLASGRTSMFYFNMKPTMLNPTGAHLIASLVLDQLAQDGIEADLIGGLEMGAIPLAAAVAAVSATSARPLSAFFVRKQAKEHGTQSLVEGLAKGTFGGQVVIIEDVTTTGGSAIQGCASRCRRGRERRPSDYRCRPPRRSNRSICHRQARLQATPDHCRFRRLIARAPSQTTCSITCVH